MSLCFVLVLAVSALASDDALDNSDLVALRASVGDATCPKDAASIDAFVAARNWPVALACALGSIEFSPKRSASYAILAYVLASRGAAGDHLSAATQFAKAIKLSPREPGLAMNLGHCFHHAGLPLKAVKAYRREHSLTLSAASFAAWMQEWARMPGAFSDDVAVDMVNVTTREFRLDTVQLVVTPPALDDDFSELAPERDAELLAAVPLADDAATPPAAPLTGRANATAERAASVLQGSRLVFREAGAPSLWSAALSLAYLSASNRTIATTCRDVGLLALENHDTEHAITWMRRAILASPRLTGVYNNLGGTLRIAGNVRVARRALEAGLRRCSAQQHELYQGLSFVAKDEGDFDAARKYMLQAIEQAPLQQYWTSYAALIPNDKVDERIAAYNKALALQPSAILAFCNRAELYAGAGMWDELAHDLPQLHQSIERALLGHDGVSVISEPCIQPFHSTYLPIEPALQRRIAESYALKETVAQPLPPVPPKPLAGRRLNVAYMSSDFGNHPLGRFVQALFAAHDRARFHVICVSTAPQDAADVSYAAIRSGCETWVDIAPAQSHYEAAQIIRIYEPDVLVDLNGWTQGRRPRTLAYRPAPVQMLHAWGYIGTSGASFLDYFITDHVVSPANTSALYSEKLVQLPFTYFPISHSVAHPAAALDAIDRVALRAQLGLPRDAVVVANFQSVLKISADAFDSWCRIVASQSNALLWMLRPPSNETRARLQQRCAKLGVPAERLVFGATLEPDSHIKRMLVADLFVDADLYGAHSTGADALWAGVPLLTFAGDKLCSRVGASMLHSLGLAEQLLVADRAAFEARARALIADPAALAELRALVLRRRASPLFDINLYARGIEAAFVRAYERFAAGLPAEAISIEPKDVGVTDRGAPVKDEL
jgi:protein O-GlcNAc transferase